MKTDIRVAAAENRTIGHALLGVSLACAVVVYVLSLYIFSDYWLTDSGETAGAAARPKKAAVVHGAGGFDFAPVVQKPLKTVEEVLAATLMAVEVPGRKSDQGLYLRVDTAECFSNNGMKTENSRWPGRSWPDFAFETIPTEIPHTPEVCRITFYKNFEARLPYPPLPMEIGGPLPYCAMLDGSIRLEQTIAVGDEFEVRFATPAPLAATDVIDRVAPTSALLAYGMLDTLEIRKIADGIATAAASPVETVFAIRDFLEANGVYKADFKRTTELHPVQEFLTTGMQGHCQHFAGSVVLLCRLKGIPARMGGGYLSDFYSEGRYLVTGAMAHAWAEVLTTHGWKLIDVAAARTPEGRKEQQSGKKVPTKEQLQQQLETNRQQAARQAREEGTAERNSGDLYEKELTEAKPPGTVLPDKNRLEQHKKKQQEKQQQEEQKKQAAQKSAFTKMLKSLFAGLLGVLVLYVVRHNFDRLMRWLIKMLTRRKEQEEEEPVPDEQEKLLLEPGLQLSAANLAGLDLVELFASFSQLMEERGHPRSDPETAAEYFERLCISFNLRPAQGRHAARLLEAELYGQRTHSPADLESFVTTLRQLLAKVS